MKTKKSPRRKTGYLYNQGVETVKYSTQRIGKNTYYFKHDSRRGRMQLPTAPFKTRLECVKDYVLKLDQKLAKYREILNAIEAELKGAQALLQSMR